MEKKEGKCLSLAMQNLTDVILGDRAACRAIYPVPKNNRLRHGKKLNFETMNKEIKGFTKPS